jgi:hypothetical protein
VLDELVGLIKKDVTSVKEENVVSGFIRYPNLSDPFNLSSSLPLLLVYDEGFTFEPENLGLSYGESRDETSQDFSCDGKNSEFKLSRLPVRPLISVETPMGNKLSEYEDFVVNYKSGVLKFRTSPSKGKNNLKVRYLANGGVGESKGIRLRVKCLIDCFAKDIYECDKLVLEVIKAIMTSNEELSYRGINIKPVQSTRIEFAGKKDNIGGDIDTSQLDKSTSGETIGRGTKKAGQKKNDNLKTTIGELFGRRLSYEIETSVEVETKIPTIKEIHLNVEKDPTD